jgi:hypothetical protein
MPVVINRHGYVWYVKYSYGYVDIFGGPPTIMYVCGGSKTVMVVCGSSNTVMDICRDLSTA